MDKFLKELNLSKEQAQKILEKYQKEREEWESKINGKDTELQTANTSIKNLKDEIKKFDGKFKKEDFENKILEYEKTINDLKSENEKLTKTYSLKESLRSKGITKDYIDFVIFKQGGFDKFSYDEEGNPTGLEEILKPYKKSMPSIFMQEGEYIPKSGESYKGFNPWDKQSFNLTEQGRIFKENLAQAYELASAAGVKIQL